MGTQIDEKALKRFMKDNNLLEIFRILFNIKDKQDLTVKPSQFIQEMNLTTEERYKKLTQISSQDAGPAHRGITVTPRIIIFQSFELRKTYTQMIQIRNRRKSLLPLKIICPKSAYFTVKFSGTPMTKIAPGLSLEYNVTFCPSELKDYTHHLELKTEEGTLFIPIIAIGPRALLDIPDEITVPPAPVKISATKTVLVRNIGTIPVNFTFITKGCFKVEPAKGVVGLHEILELSIIFESSSTGNYSEPLYLNLESGERLIIKLYGSAENVCIRLDKNCIIQEDTYVGLKRFKLFHIQNNSQSLIRYSWKRNKTMKEDLDIIESMREKYEAIKDIEVLKDMKQIYYKVCSHKCHELAWERILNDELRLLQREQLNFHHPNFKIEPENGQIFPKNHAEIFAFFEPTNCGPVSAEAYLEVSGRDERLILQLKGNGLGPLIKLSIEILDIDFIFLCSVHTYEVIAFNNGDISGTVRYKQEPLVFGGKAEVIPNERCLKPSEHFAFLISFTSNRQGEFSEKLNFEIIESGEIITLILKGKIVSPTLHFDKSSIDFGTVPVGFPVSKEVTLNNLSMVPVTFSLRVLSDGIQPSISCDTYAKFSVKPTLPKNPKEFTINPSEGVVEPFSSRSVALSLTANIPRKWTTNLVVDMWDSETESVSCPIRLNSLTATVKAEPKVISIPFCFCNFPYMRIVTLKNISRIAAFFYIIPQDPNVPNTVTYAANINQGVIEPRGFIKVTITIIIKALGRQTIPVNFLIFGNETPVEMCTVCCVGQGPVVTLNPNVLQWGEVHLLQESTKFLTITNESPISANFTVTMAKTDSPWIVNPHQSTLEPGEKINLNVSLFLRDRGKYRDILKIQIVNGKTLTCATTAMGVGNSLMSEPNIAGKYDWGTLFSRKKYYFEIILRNEGTKTVSTILCPMEDCRQFVNMKFVNPPELLFKMEPTKIELPGGSSRVLTLEIYSNKTGLFSQKFYCHGNSDLGSKEIYMTSEMSAEFVEPILLFDKTDLRFSYNVEASGTDEKLTDVVNIINASVLSLSMIITVNLPFYLKNSSGEIVQRDEIFIEGKETKALVVGFKAKENPQRICNTFRDKLSVVYNENSQKLSLPLNGEVNYPNVVILPRKINFGCIPVGSSAYKEFILVNVSPVVVHYRISWRENASVIYHGKMPHSSPIDRSAIHSENSDLYNSPEYNEDASEEYETKNLENNLEMDMEQKFDYNGALPPEKPVLKIPEITIKESDIRKAIFPWIRKYYTCDQQLMEAYRNASSSASEKLSEKPEFMKLFDITPFFGRLEKYESQIITVCFKPNSPVSANVQAVIDIEAGVTETLSIEGKAAFLDFSLSSIYIDFGKQLFCDTASEYLKIRNTSILEFDFETNTVDPVAADMNGDMLIETGVLIITPKTGHLPALSEKTLRIQYHPGLPGKFEENFQIRIGYLQPLSVFISGLAVFPQVHFDLPRSEILNVPVETSYAAIASITCDWLITQMERKKSIVSMTSNKSDQTKKRDIGSYWNDPEELDDSWAIIYKGEHIPSQIDMELAIERILAFKLLSKGNIFHSNPRSIQNFLVPGYEIDFGIVTIGRSVSKSFTVTNYGSLPAVLFVTSDKNSKYSVMTVKMKNRNEIKVGETLRIVINCYPKRSKFSEQHEKIEQKFFFEVYQGAKIPVKASAVITYPFIMPSCRLLNFSEVRCGNSKTMFIRLTNFGWVPALWSISFRLTPKEVAIMHQSGLLDGRPMFHLAVNKGILHPNENTIIQISFKPEFGGIFSAPMIIKVEEGFDEHRIMVTGEAIEPRLKISETVINFEPTLPYSQNLYKQLTLQNPCNFPIEFYFPDFDEQIYEEERVLRALMQYYQTNELLFPSRNAGDKLPQEIFEFYQHLLENLNAKYAGRMKEKRLQSLETSSLMFIPPIDTSASDTNEKKRLRTKRISSLRPRSSFTLRSGTSLNNFSLEATSIFKDKTADEIEDLLNDYLKSTPVLETRLDPVGAVLEAAIPSKKKDTTKPLPGLIIILHGAPQTNLIKFSNLCTQTVDKRSLTIDRIILEEVTLGRCEAAIILRDLIEQISSGRLEGIHAANDPESHYHVFQDKQENDFLYQKIQDDLERKLEELYLLRYSKNHQEFTLDFYSSSLSSRDEGSSGLKIDSLSEDKQSGIGSGKREKLSTPNVKWITQTTDVLEGCDNLIFQILKFRLHLEAPTGLVIENLRSKWISNPVTALKLLIKAADNIKNILVVCLTKSYDNHKQYMEELELEEEKERQFAKEEALRILEEEPLEKFMALNFDSDVKKELYFTFLNKRYDEYNAFRKTIDEKENMRKMTKMKLSSMMTSPKVQQISSHKVIDKQPVNNHVKINTNSKDKEKTPYSPVKTAKIGGKDETEKLGFLNFENQLLEIIHFLEFWDKRLNKTVEVHTGNKGKKSATPKKFSIMDEIDSNNNPEIGIHLWIIDEKNWKSTTVEYTHSFLKEALSTMRTSYDLDFWATDLPDSMTYTVMTYPPRRNPHKIHDAFSITAVNRNVSGLTDDSGSLFPEKSQISESILSLKVGKGSSNTSKFNIDVRTLGSSKNSGSKKSLTSSPFESLPFKSRLILQEGEIASWCIHFAPTKVGRFDQHFPINIVSLPPHNNFVIKCTGLCDIPRLDMKPENIFSRVADAKPQDLIYSPTFFYSNYYFDFGSVIPNQVKDNNHNRELHAIFSLTNISSLPVELTVMFADDALREEPIGSQNFDIEPNSAYLKPNQTFLLNVYANPSKYGGIQEVLMLFVKGNPKIETIRMKCYGVRVSVNIEPKSIDFDRMLLYRKDKKTITFTNSNLIPLFLVLSGYDNLPPQFSFSAVKTWVDPLMSYKIVIEYEASQVQVITEEVVNVLVYDRVEAVEPVQTLSFTVSAEAYDASVDIFFSSKDDDHVDFGEVRIENDYSETVTLKNTGKYPLGFKIDVNNELLEKIGKEEFYVTPFDGKLQEGGRPQMGKPVTIEVHFRAHTEVNWKKVPIFKIILLEPYNKDELVASIPILVSAKSFYSRCIIQPLSEVNIGPVQVGSQKIDTLSIENTGQFSFNYSIEPSWEYEISPADVSESKKSAKTVSELSSKEKPKKLMTTSLKTDSFHISPSFGVVDVKETAIIKINFTPTEVKHYEELVIIKITESPPSLKDGQKLKILAEGCLPQLNLNDFHSIFREHVVKMSEKEPPFVPDIGYHTIFTIDTKQFCFKNVCLDKIVEARLHLKNEGHIDCHVTSLVNRFEGKRKSSFEMDGGNFWVKPSEIIIPPYESGTFVIYFHPEMLQNYKGQLSVTLSMPEKYGPSTTVFDLYGVTCTPKIDIVEPSYRSPEGRGLVSFPPTSPGISSNSVISFKNTGKVECKVVVEMNCTEQDIFSMVPKPECEGMLKTWERSRPINYATIVIIQPEEIAEFIVIFKPIEIKKYSCEIKLFIVDNGYENLCYQLSGEAFLEEVILEKIQTTMPFIQEYSDCVSKTIPWHYSLNLGQCFVNRKKKFLARLSNNTETDYFKFEWLDIPSFIIIQPKIGHLYPKTYKETYFVFHPKESLTLEEAPLICSLTKIKFPGSPPSPSWDSRLIHVIRTETDPSISNEINKLSSQQEIENLEEIHTYGQEPQHEIIPDTNSEVVLHLSVVADYAYFQCETTSVNFADTFMFQNRSFSLPLENTGNVAFDYKFELKSVIYESLKIDSSLQDMDLVTKARSLSACKIMTKSKEQNVLEEDLSKPQSLQKDPLLDMSSKPEMQVISEPEPVEIRNEMYNPFQLENSSGTLMPKEKACCRVIFSPLDVYEYTALIKIRVGNTHPDQVIPEITVFARSIMPYCHFDLPESDYISSGRRDFSRPGPIGSGPGLPLHLDVKTIEINVLGIRVTKLIHFHVINPTDNEYSFSWLNVTQKHPNVVQSLYCTFLNGSIQAGRQKLMEFVFASHAPGIFEYFWKFLLPERNIEVLFLFVVNVQEPVIYFLTNNLIMRPTSVGATVSDTIRLVNQDDVSSDFMFLPDSLLSEDRLNSLMIQPLSGKINPKSEIDFRVTFTGKIGGKMIFNLKFKLKKLNNPLRITVETMTYSIEPLVTFLDLTKSKQIADSTMNNIIDLGKEIQLETSKTVTFFLTNASKLPFNYEWSYDKKELMRQHCSMVISHVEGYVKAQSRVECDLTFMFTKKGCLSSFPVKLKIMRGPIYNFLINANAVSLMYQFSFTSYDFGYCCVQETDFTFYETTLVFRNKDTVETFLEVTADNLSHFSCKFQQSTIPPGGEVIIPIKFRPTECVKYEEIITFGMAGLYEKVITLLGHGTEFKVSLLNVSDSNIRLTAVRVGRKQSREISLVNKGLATVSLLVGFSDQLPVNALCFTHPDEYSVDLTDFSRMLTLSPSKPFTLQPKESCILTIEYNAQRRISSFTETIYMQFHERIEPLCIVTGSSIGPEFVLDKKYLTFGAVVANYSSTLKLKLINSGDIGGRFKWKTENLDNEFSIIPESGYLSAESDIIICVNFHPKSIQRCIKKTAECKLYLSETETYPPLLLTLSGDCVDLPQPKQSVQFKCEVRNTDTKTIEINNRTGTDWRLIPVFSGENFDGLEFISVPSMTSTEYEISYNPSTMAPPDKPHKGSLFFCLPDGSGQLYDLIGVSLPPSACEVIEREVPCKTKYIELLKVKNWLKSHQKFRVTRKSIGHENVDDLVATCSGVDVFDLMPSSEKEYKVVFHSYKTGKLRFAITFTNEETKEYVWFDLTFNIVMCGPLEVINLKSSVRQLNQHEIKIQNPLKTSVLYKAECANPEVTTQSSVLAPKSNGTMKIGYRPIHSGEKTEQLKIICAELGVFPIELRLIALDPLPEESVQFETFLGSTNIQTILVPNYHNSQAVLHCQTTSTEFRVAEKVTVGGQDSIEISIIYEPCSLGKTTATLHIKSDNAGDFTYPLIGNSLSPLPKGPYILKMGTTMTILFKNVFKEAKIFQIYVDNPAFSVNVNTEEILPGNERKINISFQELKNGDNFTELTRNATVKYPVMGQLIVECSNPQIKWQYYLKGIVDKVSKS